MVKHPACAAAISSSGLVPLPFSKRETKVYGVCCKIPLCELKWPLPSLIVPFHTAVRSEEHTSELQSRENLVCRLLLEKKKKTQIHRNKKRKEKLHTVQNEFTLLTYPS